MRFILWRSENYKLFTPEYLMTTDFLPQKRNGIKYVNMIGFMKNGQLF